MKNYLASAKEYWHRQKYHFLRPEYERLQDKLLNWPLASLLISFGAVAILAIIQKHLSLQINYGFCIQVVFTLTLCSVVGLVSAALTLRWVDEHEKKLSKKVIKSWKPKIRR